MLCPLDAVMLLTIPGVRSGLELLSRAARLLVKPLLLA